MQETKNLRRGPELQTLIPDMLLRMFRLKTKNIHSILAEKNRKMKRLILCFLALFSAASIYAQKENPLIRSGNKLYGQGKFKDAEISYRKALESSPKSTRSEYNLGSSLYRQKEWEEAGKSYLSAAGRMKDSDAAAKAAALHNLGNTMVKAEKYAEGIEAYKQALRLNPADQDTRYNLSYAMRKMQQQQQQQQQNDQNKEDKKDKQDQQQNQQQQPQDQNDQQQQNQQQQKQQISKQDAERMLQALKNDEQKTMDKVKKQKAKPVQVQVEKDW